MNQLYGNGTGQSPTGQMGNQGAVGQLLTDLLGDVVLQQLLEHAMMKEQMQMAPPPMDPMMGGAPPMGLMGGQSPLLSALGGGAPPMAPPGGPYG